MNINQRYEKLIHDIAMQGCDDGHPSQAKLLCARQQAYLAAWTILNLPKAADRDAMLNKMAVGECQVPVFSIRKPIGEMTEGEIEAVIAGMAW